MPLRLSLPVVYCSLLLFAELVLAKLTPVPLIHGRDGPLVAHDGSTRTGEGPKSRIVVVVVMLFCMFLLAGSLGFRLQKLDWSRLSFPHALVYLQNVLAMGLVLSAAVVAPGLGMKTEHQCYSAVMICIVFYTLGKLVLYMFLTERAHIIRAAFLCRSRDRIYLAFMTFIAIGPGALMIVAYLTAVSELSPHDGRCRIGILRIPSYILLCFDGGINIALTGVFIWFLWPVIRFSHGRRSNSSSLDSTDVNISPQAGSTERERRSRFSMFSLSGFRPPFASAQNQSLCTRNQVFLRSVKTMIWRNVIGSSAILIFTATNGIIFWVSGGRELGWLCLITCTIDTTGCVLIVHWLTLGSVNEENTFGNCIHERRPLSAPVSTEESRTNLPSQALTREPKCERLKLSNKIANNSEANPREIV